MIRLFLAIVLLFFVSACREGGFTPLSIDDQPELTNDQVFLGDMVIKKSDILGYGLEPEEAEEVADEYLKDFEEALEKYGENEISTAGVFEKGLTKWPNGRLPIKFASNINKSDRTHFFNQCKILGKRAKVRCVNAGSAKNYIRVKTGKTGCGWSYLGMIGGKQDLYVSRDCWRGTRTIKHELMHALGIAHEHNHPQRGKKVSIKWDNIIKKYKHNFYRVKNAAKTSNYNFGSIMHYSSYAFSKNGKRTIQKKSGSKDVPYGTSMTNSDHAILEKIYGKK